VVGTLLQGALTETATEETRWFYEGVSASTEANIVGLLWSNLMGEADSDEIAIIRPKRRYEARLQIVGRATPPLFAPELDEED